MRVRFAHQAMLGILLIFQLSVCLATESPDPNENSKYLDAVREFADNVLKYGRDTYGPKHTPLFVDGLNIHTHEPVKWIAPNGERWILSSLSSQQNLLRTLDGLTKTTGDPKYRQAAVEAIEYAFANLRSSNGLLHWGRVAAYDAKAEKVCGAAVHSLKFDYPYYELMWEVNPTATKQFIESFWSAHILDWSNLVMNRTASLNKPVGQAWKHEYKGGTVFFESQGSSFVNTGSDLYYAAAILSKQSGDKLPLIWSKRLAHRYVETRDPNVGISGYVYNRNVYRKVPTFYPFGDDFKGHLVLLGTLFPKHPGVGNPDVRQWLLGELIVSPGIAGNVFIIPWICQFLLGDMLGEDGKEFTQWALEELTAWGKIAYRKKDNSFIPMLTDGTTLEGYVCKKDSSFGPKGTVFTLIPAVSMDFWAYALGYRMTGDSFMWDMARNIAHGIGFGDIGVSSDSKLQLKKDTGCSDPYVLLGFLELYKKTGTKAFLRMAERIGDNILTDNFYKGFFVPSHKHTYAKFDAIYSLVLLHLNAATDIKPSLVPRVWPSRPSFNVSYRGKESVIDNAIIYNLTESSEVPKSLQEAAAAGEIHEIKSLISKGADVNGREDTFLKTALHRAVISGHKDVVEFLLTKGADVNAGDVYAATALHYAAELGHIEVARLLIAKGADVNAGNEWNRTPLYSAVSGGNKDVAELLIAKRADVSATNNLGDTPLHYAAKSRAAGKDIIELLIAKGADVNAKNNDGQTAIDIAMSRNRKEIVELLLAKGATISSIHVAAQIGDLTKVKAFLEEGTDVNAKDGRGYTPFHYAIWYYETDIARFLIEKGADLHAKDQSGYTPLHWAVMMDNKELTELILAKGADVNTRGKAGETPLDFAMYVGKAIGQLLVEKGAEVSSLQSAAFIGDLAKVKSFLDEGVDVNTKNAAGVTALQAAASGVHKEVAELLIAKGADINISVRNGETPLHWAARAGSREVVELLISKGADVNAKDKRGRTPLDIAVDQGHTEIVELLRKHIADLKSSSEPRHDVAITGISVLSRGPQDYNVPVVVNLENQGDCGESFDVKLIDVTDEREIGTKSVTLSPAGAGGMDAICDLSLFGENLGDDAHTTNTGDIDGDGYTDLIVGAMGYNSSQGRAYLYYGGPDMDNKPDLVFDGEPNAASGLGWPIGVGDVDNDGYDDIVIGAGAYNNKRGRAYLYWGASRASMDAKADLIFEGENADDSFSASWDDIIVEDIDEDGYDDIVIPAVTYGPSEGRAYLYWGNIKARMDAKADLIFAPPDGGGWFGVGLDCGDIDNDGYKDIVIGARTYGSDNYGRAYLYWGNSQENMDADCDLIFEAENATESQSFGVNVGIGDVDKDGYEDIVIGANTFDNVQGRAYLYWGASRANMDTDCDLTFTGEAGRGGFAELCICDGDVNADGYADVLISARQYDNFRGRAYLYLGGTKERMDTQAELILTGENERDWFGDPPGGSFGDFNNDGYDDLAIGARMWQSNTEQGRVYVYYGGPTILRSDAAAVREESPTKSLHRAASDGDIDLVKSFISKGANVNSLDAAHRTPLHSAAMQGHREVVEFLVASSADINAKDKWGYTPIDVVIDVVGTRNRKETVELLTKNGATISTIHIAAFVGDLTKVKDFVQEGIDVNGLDANGHTPLLFAAQAGQTDIVEFLIAKGADVKAENRRGETPLHSAAANGDKEVVELLIAKGADVNAENRRGETPLYIAAAKGHKGVAELLIVKGADVDGKSKSGYVPLSWAVWNEDRDMIKLLVIKGADVNFVAEDDWPFLHYVAWNDDRELVELLLARGARLNVKDSRGRTEFRIAVSRGHRDLAEFLVSKGAEAPAFHLAVCLGDLDRVKNYLEEGMEVDAKDELGWTPLYWAASTAQEEIAEFFISKGADIDVRTNDNRTPLHQAARSGPAKLVELLISKGADSNARDKNDSTPLHSAAEGGHKNIVEFLIAKGAEVETKEKSGNTPLHKAAAAGHVDVVEVLLAHGVDVNAKGRRDRTALTLAQRNGHTEIVELLHKHGAKE